ncbi:hypothetical protein QEZ54_04820 [Catellatospora sp. KI3]|uniref:hypothetical protein n=1 Tax=Catellatospora sp. KI3 TaxID=3041620 RepID=UPI002482BA67|nr:hypothetical protein [Catellatospora sp. KI3]MDI1460281.1 hypothetical protein [Catellatospora sp. KI3]
MMRFWVRQSAAGFGLAALIAAAQFGVVYGLNALRLDREFLAGTDNDWNLQLSWVAWFALCATVGGATFAAGLAQREAGRVGAGVRVLAACTAALGAATVALPLTLQPARYAVLHASFDPQLTAALAVGAGVIAGLLLSLFVVARSPLSTNLWAFTAGMWVLAVVSFLDTAQFGRNRDSLGDYYDPIRLGVLDISSLQPIPRASFTAPALALLVALVCGLAARRAGRSRTLIALSGATGPLLIAIAYGIGGPGLSRSLSYQADAYLGAMIAVVVGLLVTTVIALAPRRAPTRPAF